MDEEPKRKPLADSAKMIKSTDITRPQVLSQKPDRELNSGQW